MPSLSDLWFRIRTLLGLSRSEDELDEEIEFHLDMEARKHASRGESAEAARLHAQRDFGNVTRQKQAIRDGWGIGMIRDFVADLRLAARQLRRTPGFTTTVLLTLALGIGATTAIASIVRQVLLRRPPVTAPEQLAVLYTTCRRGDLRCSSSYPDFLDYRDRSRRFAGMAAASPVPLNLGTESGAHLALGEVVSGEFFPLLGLRPHLGRLVMPSDDERGNAQPVVVLSHDFWRSAFGADPAVLGSTVLLNGARFEVIGVGPPGYRGLGLTTPRDVWLPMHAASLLGPAVGAAGESDVYDERGARWIGTIVGRLAAGATVDQGREEMAAISAQLAEEFPEDRAAVAGPRQITVDPAEHYILPVGREAELRQFLWLLIGVVTFTLVLACANIANLLLARATARGRELGVQLAVGASRPRLIRKLLAESLLLSLLGAAAGLLVAKGMLTVLANYELPGGVAIGAVGVTLDGTVLAVALLLALGTAILFGLVPAWHATRLDLVSVMKGDPPRPDGLGISQLRRGLVAVQVALCLVLLAGSVVFARTLRNSLSANLGFQASGTAVLQYNAGLLQLDQDRSTAVRHELLDRVRAIPGVTSASLSTLTPLQPGGFRGFFATIDGYVPQPDEEIRFDAVLVSDGYFESTGIPVTDGRPIEAGDIAGARPVMLVNRFAAERYWPGRSAVGGVLRLGADFEATVVGVVDNPTWAAIGEDPTPFVFLAMDQAPEMVAGGFLTLAARSDGAAPSLLPSMRAAFAEVLPALSPSRVATLDDQVNAVLMPQRLGALLLTAFGALTLLLAGIGIYGVVGYSILRQSREIGIRIAIGSSTTGILRTVVLGMAGPILLGLAVGVLATVALERTVASFMYQVSPTDPGALLVVGGVLTAVALIAVLIPARRAARIDPAKVLTCE